MLLLMVMVKVKIKKISKKKLLITLLIVVFLLVVAASYYWIFIPYQRSWQGPKTASDMVKSIQQETNKSTALGELQRLASETSNKDDKNTYLIAAASMAFNYTRDFDNILSISQGLEDNEPTADSAAYIAAAYDYKKDYKNAAAYYEIAAQRSPKPETTGDRSAYTDYIILQNEEEAKLNAK